MPGNAPGNLFVIAMVSGQRVAFDATRIASVVDLTSVVPVPLSPRYVLGLCTLRSVILTVVDLAAALELGAEQVSKRAVTMDIDGHNYAFIVKSVEQVEPSRGPVGAVDGSVGSNWAPYVSGTIETESGLALLVDLPRLLALSEEATFPSGKSGSQTQTSTLPLPH